MKRLIEKIAMKHVKISKNMGINYLFYWFKSDILVDLDFHFHPWVSLSGWSILLNYLFVKTSEHVTTLEEFLLRQEGPACGPETLQWSSPP